jgi:hypothetical protein
MAQVKRKRAAKKSIKQPIPEKVEIKEIEPIPLEKVELSPTVVVSEGLLSATDKPIEKVPVITIESVKEIELLKENSVAVKKAIQWRKVGLGTFTFKNRKIKPNQVFTATEDEIPKGFRDVIIPLEEIPSNELITTKKDSNYTLKVRLDAEGKETAFWDVISKQGKKINEIALSYNDAITLLKAL